MIGAKWTDLTPEAQEAFSQILNQCAMTPEFYQTAFIHAQKGMSAIESQTNQELCFTTEMKDAVGTALVNLTEQERISYSGVDIVKNIKTYPNRPAYFICWNSSKANAQLIISVF